MFKLICQTFRSSSSKAAHQTEVRCGSQAFSNLHMSYIKLTSSNDKPPVTSQIDTLGKGSKNFFQVDHILKQKSNPERLTNTPSSLFYRWDIRFHWCQDFKIYFIKNCGSHLTRVKDSLFFYNILSYDNFEFFLNNLLSILFCF